jgi:hypothetical protein
MSAAWRETWRDMVDRAADRGAQERPPVPGWAYVAFVVHPHGAAPVVLAIAHREGTKAVLDVIRESISVADSAGLVKRYGITKVTSAPDEGQGDSLAHAACGAMVIAMQGA